MYLKNVKDSGIPILIAVVISFTLGLVLGAVFFFYTPENIIKDLNLTFDSNNIMAGSLADDIKNNFITEIMWIILIWIINNIRFTSPLSVALVAFRGFLISFSVTFILQSENSLKWILGSIVPQMILAMPLLTFFTAIAVRLSVERKENKSSDTAFYIMGGIFVIITALTSVLEAVMGRFFISFL